MSAAVAALYQSRLTFGRRFDDPAPVGDPGAWLSGQLAANGADGAEVSAVLAARTVPWRSFGSPAPTQMAPAAYRMTAAQAQVFYLARKSVWDVPDSMFSEMQLVWLVRAACSPDQLFERVVDFWHDHFAMDMDQAKTNNVRKWFAAHDRVIRDHALGDFGALLLGVARSPVMMVDLDLGVSAAPRPNENYAREVMELHTLGIGAYLGPATPPGRAGAGYSDADVTAAAAVLSGWTCDQDGAFEFVPRHHLGAPDRALGQEFGAGVAAGERLLAWLAAHPQTARFIATKLYLRFVADAVPPGSKLLAAMEAAFSAHAGSPRQIASVIEAMATHPEFLASAGQKLKSPRHLLVSLLRATGAEFELVTQALDAVAGFGAPIYDYPVPAGPPADTASYVDAGALLRRWSLGASILDPEGEVVPRPGWPSDADRRDALDAALADPATGRPDPSPAAVAARLAAALLGPSASPASLAAVQGYALSSEGITARMLARPDMRLRAALARVAGTAAAMPEFQVC